MSWTALEMTPIWQTRPLYLCKRLWSLHRPCWAQSPITIQGRWSEVTHLSLHPPSTTKNCVHLNLNSHNKSFLKDVKMEWITTYIISNKEDCACSLHTHPLCNSCWSARIQSLYVEDDPLLEVLQPPGIYLLTRVTQCFGTYWWVDVTSLPATLCLPRQALLALLQQAAPRL